MSVKTTQRGSYEKNIYSRLSGGVAKSPEAAKGAQVCDDGQAGSGRTLGRGGHSDQ